MTTTRLCLKDTEAAGHVAVAIVLRKLVNQSGNTHFSGKIRNLKMFEWMNKKMFTEISPLCEC